jgi:TatD DNase family protein
MAASTPAPEPLLFDTHAHLHDPAFDADRDDVLQRARESGVQGLVTVGTDLDTSVAAIELAKQYDGVWASIGVHPHDAKDWDVATLTRMVVLAREEKVVALGEIGLDFFRDLSPRDVQREAFAAQLALADQLELPVIIHSRDAHEETASILEAWASGGASGGASGRGAAGRTAGESRATPAEAPLGVVHCFSGDLALAQRYVETGLLISFAGPVTYPKNHDLREAAVRLRGESIVVETDCPYLTPQSKRGTRNEPAFVAETSRYIAELRGEEPEAFARQCSANAARLFRLAERAKMQS